MPKVLYVATVANHIKEHHLPFIRMLQEHGHQVEVACHLNLPLDGLTVHEIPFDRRLFSRRNLDAYRSIGKLIAGGGYSLIHVHTPVASFLTRLAARKSEVPVLYTAHGFHFYQGAPLWNRLVYYTAERLACRWSAALIVINQEDLTAAKGFGLIEGRNLFYVPGVGVDIGRYDLGSSELEVRRLMRRRLGVGDGDPVAICIGEFIPRKNHSQLLRAWRLVVDELATARLWLVGRGELEQQLRQQVADLGLERQVFFLGYRNDIPELLAAADLLTLASRQEGLTKVVLESMAAARPVVATDVRGNRDLVEDGINGYLVPLDVVQPLAGRLLALLRDPVLSRQMGLSGREKVAAYSLDRIEERLWRIYSCWLG